LDHSELNPGQNQKLKNMEDYYCMKRSKQKILDFLLLQGSLFHIFMLLDCYLYLLKLFVFIYCTGVSV